MGSTYLFIRVTDILYDLQAQLGPNFVNIFLPTLFFALILKNTLFKIKFFISSLYKLYFYFLFLTHMLSCVFKIMILIDLFNYLVTYFTVDNL